MISNNVRELRNRHFMSQQELADAAGLVVRTIVSIEGGKGCHNSTKRLIIEAFHIPLSEGHRVFPFRFGEVR